jgi:hypothetical protein
MGSNKMIPRYAFHTPFTVSLPDTGERDWGTVPLKEGGITWYTDRSKTDEGTGARMYGHGMKQSSSFSLEQYAMVFKAKVYVIKACTNENIKKSLL